MSRHAPFRARFALPTGTGGRHVVANATTILAAQDRRGIGPMAAELEAEINV